MIGLESKMHRNEFLRYTSRGYFTIRRTSKFFSGTWSDMIIEQTLMRLVHCAGGLGRGRGISESVKSNWILSLSASVEISQSLENFLDLKSENSEQHKDLRDANISRDEKHMRKFFDWFNKHEPFPETSTIMSIATGVASKISNCY
ncbi:GSCOCG00012670001-RA-CDS, partial [Cotesia congregata]